MSVLTGYLLLFLIIPIGFVFVHLALIGKLVRPTKPDPDKLTIYECGEPTIGSAWIQFDLRFYVVALLFVIFDVEVAFFFPWALVFGKATALSNPQLPPEEQRALTADLMPNAGDGALDARIAGQLAWLSFWDILVFFGVLLVGFAYLWKRGDLDWVRSIAAEKAAAPGAGALPEAKPDEATSLVGAGRGA
jgi:NADH-quinone oxidoreductase subunit A